MSVTNQNKVRQIFKGLDELYSGLPCSGRMSPDEWTLSNEVFRLLRKGISGLAIPGTLSAGCSGEALDTLKNAYFTACQLRLKHQIEVMREDWSDVIAHVEIAKNVFDDFEGMKRMHQVAMDAFNTADDYGDVEKVCHYDELRCHVENMVKIDEVLSRGRSDFNSACKQDRSNRRRIPLTAAMIGGGAAILAAVITLVYSVWNDHRQKSDSNLRTPYEHAESVKSPLERISSRNDSYSWWSPYWFAPVRKDQ